MATLIDVLSEFFRAFGYTPTLGTELEGTTGRRHALPLLLEKDSRRLAVTSWIHRQALGPAFLEEFTDAVKDTGCDGGLIVSLGAVPDALLVQGTQDRILLWDSRRAAQELGNAVLRETCADVWEQADPWAAPKPSKILDQLHQTVLAVEPAAAAPVSPAPVNEAAQEPAFPAAIEPMLAPPEAAAPETLETPLAFSLLDMPVAPPVEGAPPQVTLPTAGPVEYVAMPSPPAPAFVPPAYVPVLAAGTPRGKNVLRIQVSRALVTNLAKPKIRTVEKVFLRLVPYYVFDYEASLLIEGSLETQKQTGRISVDAATKKVKPWTHGLELGLMPEDGVDVDEKPIRLQETEARKLVTGELKALVTRDVVMEEDDSEWSVVVKKKVELSDEELRLTLQGVYWAPVWRATGKDGSVEIDATTGQFVFEDISSQKSDALLI